ncbi:MAG TPA: type II secretion system F family protein [Myxococcota bacterium]|nr:type II secretion system F family protein [Myxococcota bacterium]
MMDFVPPWLDGLTTFRLGALLPFIGAWAVVGWFFGPWAERRFLTQTSGYVDWMQEMFDKMFMEVPARYCVGFIVVSIVASIGLGFLVTAGLPFEGWYHIIRVVVVLVLVIGPFGFPSGYSLPRFVIKKMWENRILRFETQLLDALSFMSNGLKSGLSLVQCMDMVREELPNPVAQEFKLLMDEQRVGVPMEEALLNLESRIDTEDVQIMVTSINILRQSGGNLSETFDTISYTIRERQKVQGKIKSLTAQGVAQGVIIVILPFVLGGVLWTMDPELISRMWTTAVGWGLLLVMMTLQAVGALLIRRIVQIKV